jgi:hypothetical protein
METVTWRLSYINIYLIYTYIFSHPSFTIEVEDGSKKIKFCFIESLSFQCELFRGEVCQSSFLSLSLSRIDVCRANRTLSSHTLWYKKNTHTEKSLKRNSPNCTQILKSRSLTRNPIGAPNEEGGRTTPYKLIKKISVPQSCRLDLNLGPESWRLPHQIQSCLARRYYTMDSLGPD